MFATVRALRLLRTSRWISTGSALRADLATPDESIYTEQHWEMRRALRKIIDKEINPYVDQWEKDHIFPAHKVSLCRTNRIVCSTETHAHHTFKPSRTLGFGRCLKHSARRDFWVPRAQWSTVVLASTTVTPSLLVRN